MLDVGRNLENVRSRIAIAEKKYHREAGSVTLIAVSKTKSVRLIQSAIDVGQQIFGESYIQEAVLKIEQINDPMVQWHFIGPIQSNKTRLIAESFDWVHSIDRSKIARRLNDQRPQTLSKLNVCIQVNISDEETKSGVNVGELNDLVETVLTLPNLNLRGFMTIPRKSMSLKEQHSSFNTLRKLKEGIEQQFSIALDTMSMGMSADMEVAIAEGASHIRVGTDIFGERE